MRKCPFTVEEDAAYRLLCGRLYIGLYWYQSWSIWLKVEEEITKTVNMVSPGSQSKFLLNNRKGE